MDLVVGARRVIITMTHVASNGDPKIVPTCTYPLTARGCATVVVTDLAVFRLVDGRLTLTELMPGTSLDEVLAKTTAGVEVAVERRPDQAAESSGNGPVSNAGSSSSTEPQLRQAQATGSAPRCTGTACSPQTRHATPRPLPAVSRISARN